MTISRITTIAALLLTATNAALVASQANSQPQAQSQTQQPTSLFYERQTQVTTLSGQTPAVTTTATATLSAIAQTQADSHTSDNSTSSATTAYARATNSGTDMSDMEMQQIQAYREQQELTQEQEMKKQISQNTYNKMWFSELGPNQQKIAEELVTALPYLPKDLIHLIAQYEYDFKGLLKETIKNSHAQNVTALAVLPNGSFVSGALDGTVKVWSRITNQNGQTAWKDSFADKHVREIVALVILPDSVFASSASFASASFASASVDGSIHLSYLYPDREAVWVCLGRLFSHGAIYSLIALVDGSLISAGDSHINLWPSQGEKWKKKPIIDASDSELSDDIALTALSNNSFASGHENSKIKIWLRDTSSKDPNWCCVQTIREDGMDVHSLAVLSDSSLVAGCEGGQIKIFAPTLDSHKKITWKNIETLKVNDKETEATWVGSLVALPNNSFASGSDHDSAIRVWSCCPETNNPSILASFLSFFSKQQPAWECTKTLPGLTNWYAPLAVLPDGSLVSGADDNSIKIWS